MDWLQFIAAIVGSVAWPMATVTILFLLRRELLSLIPNLRVLKFKDLSLEFERKLSKAEDVVPQIPESPVKPVGASVADGGGASEPKPVEPDEKTHAKTREDLPSARAKVVEEYLEALSKIDSKLTFKGLRDALVEPPIETILGSWRGVEETTRQLAIAAGISQTVAKLSLGGTVKLLVKSSILDEATQELITELRNMRNLAVHGDAGDITAEQAYRYASMAYEVQKRLHDILERLPKPPESDGGPENKAT
jgi:hypothetical protein